MNAFACRLSGVGEAAIALIDVAGPDARLAVEALTGRPVFSRPAVRRLGDEVVVRFDESGFTGEPTVSISCHGGSAACAAVLDRLAGAGVATLEPRAWIRRAWERRAVDRAQAEAVWHLASARTLRAARMLDDQRAGAMSRDLKAGKIDELMRRADLGVSLTHPPRVVLAGRPNAGKSTLFNALLDRERAVVSPVPGTTRDPVRDWTAIDGIPIELIDTAGVEEARDRVEAEAIERARAQAKAADLVLSVAEAGTVDIAEGLRVWSKCDRVRPSGPGVAVSAIRSEGLDELRRAILKALGLEAPPVAGQGMIFTRAQLEAIGRDPQGFLASPPEFD